MGNMRGWLLVAGQFVLLALLVVAPSLVGGPTLGIGGLRPVGTLLAVAGAVVLLVAAVQLGPALTPHPRPRDDSSLRTTGLYAWVRHPIYTGVLMLGWGLAVRAGLVASVLLACALTVLLHVKARYEERLLVQHHPGYRAYARRTGRFVPRWTARARGS
jgi:protein-S-isoprenylcysteine O-methyltransferase Ste14